MNDQFFPELARRLKREGISTGPVEKDCLPVLADGQAAVLVMPRSTVAFNADVERCPEADSVYDLTFRLSREVYEYTEAMATAPPWNPAIISTAGTTTEPPSRTSPAA